MIDLSEFHAPAAPARCAVRTWLASLKDTERAKFEAAFDDQSIHLRAIVRISRNYGSKFSESTAQRHRRGECTCP